jgi:hypothetical protein
MVGRGTRLYPGKEYLLLLDFLWHTERHELCRPACLIAENQEVADKMTEKLADSAGVQMDLETVQQEAESDTVREREASLAATLAEMRTRKRKLVDPLQYEMSIAAEDLSGYVPAFGWEAQPPTDIQKQKLEAYGIFPDEIDSAGKAKKLLERIQERKQKGLATQKQIRCLERYGFTHVGTWTFRQASNMVTRIASQGWKRVPSGVDPATYVPPAEEGSGFGFSLP